MASKSSRILTGIAGLPACPQPQLELSKWYKRILRALEKLPKESAYRITTQKLISDRKQIVETTPDPLEIERKIGGGLCEELIEQAKFEVKLVETMKEYKPWEPLTEKPLPDQWKWPI